MQQKKFPLVNNTLRFPFCTCSELKIMPINNARFLKKLFSQNLKFAVSSIIF